MNDCLHSLVKMKVNYRQMAVLVHSSKTSKNCPKRVGFFATGHLDE